LRHDYTRAGWGQVYVGLETYAAGPASTPGYTNPPPSLDWTGGSEQDCSCGRCIRTVTT